MPKDLLLYGPVCSESAKEFFENASKIEEGDDVVLRINTSGGEPAYMMGILNKVKELGAEGICDGIAYSAGGYACCLIECDGVEGSTYLIHRASSWAEVYPEYWTDADKKRLDATNKYLKKILKAKVDVVKFEKYAKHTIEEIFSTDGVLDVVLTADQAKDCGLIRDIVSLSTTKRKKVEAYIKKQADPQFKIAAMKALKATEEEEEEEEDEPTPAPKKEKSQKSNTMTIEKIKAEHPELYASIKAEGVTAERDRAGAWLAYAEIDSKKAIEGAKTDKAMTATVQSEFQVAALSSNRLNKLQADSSDKVITDTAAEDTRTDAQKAKDKEVDDAQKAINAQLGRKPKA